MWLMTSADTWVGFGGAVNMVHFNLTMLVGPVLEALDLILRQSKNQMHDQVNATQKSAQHSNNMGPPPVIGCTIKRCG